MGTYRPRPTNGRRSKADIEVLMHGLERLLVEDAPMTVRQVFYRAVSAGLVGKTEGEYKQSVVRLLGQMRRSGRIPFSWIADNTRWMRKPRTWSSVDQAL